MKRRQSILIIAALVAVALAAACAKTETNTNNANTSTNTNKTATTNTNTSNANSNVTSSSGGTPTESFKALYDAFKNKDVAALKKTVASADIRDMEESVKKQGKTLDDFLKSLVEDPSAAPPATLETRNETINGDKATLEVKDKRGGWDKVSFIKEGGEWKVRLKNDNDSAEKADNAEGMEGMGDKH
ncbi:MAG: DUF4878 domain-containing protein [Pyrinomonadaceae bacterium]|nr:DUF4878 domain-containing protein [Pyrinomonadaceae bacterium]